MNKHNPDIHNRRSIRLKGYDHSQAGAYFVTLCTQSRECLFGEIVDMEMRLNELGRIANETWAWLQQHYPYVDLDEWGLMPNHLHGIIVISDDDMRRGGSRTAPIAKRKTLGRLIGAFKTVSTKQINKTRETPGAVIWQRNYYEHIIRNDRELNSIREYIAANAARWDEDKENSALKISETRVHHVGL